MAYPIRSCSLKSPLHRQQVSSNKKRKRRRTWPIRPCHSVSPRVSKWHTTRQTNLSSVFFSPHKRLTVATISTLTSSSPSNTTTLRPPSHQCYGPKNIFHLQSTLFLFGFLCFPCWWVGGYCLPTRHVMEYQHVVIAVHPSLLANGRVCSKTLWTYVDYDPEKDTILLFYRWNRFMALVSIALLLFIASLFIWYYVAY